MRRVLPLSEGRYTYKGIAKRGSGRDVSIEVDVTRVGDVWERTETRTPIGTPIVIVNTEILTVTRTSVQLVGRRGDWPDGTRKKVRIVPPVTLLPLPLAPGELGRQVFQEEGDGGTESGWVDISIVGREPCATVSGAHVDCWRVRTETFTSDDRGEGLRKEDAWLNPLDGSYVRRLTEERITAQIARLLPKRTIEFETEYLLVSSDPKP